MVREHVTLRLAGACLAGAVETAVGQCWGPMPALWKLWRPRMVSAKGLRGPPKVFKGAPVGACIISPFGNRPPGERGSLRMANFNNILIAHLLQGTG